MTTPTSRLRRSSTSEAVRLERGIRTNPERIRKIRARHGLEPRYDRLREVGYLTVEEMAKLLGIAVLRPR